MATPSPQQLPLFPTPGLIWMGRAGNAADQQITFINLDPSNTVSISYAQNISPGSGNSIPLTPNASVTIPSNKAVWACAPPNTLPLVVIPGSIQYTPGNPLLTALTTNGSQFTHTAPFTILGAAQMVPLLPPTDVSSFASYDISLYAFGSPSVALSSLTLQITVQWFDDLVSGIPVFEEDWFIYLGGSFFPGTGISNSVNANPMNGNGPMHGRYMAVYASQSGNTPVTIQWFNLFGSGRTLTVSDWRQNILAIPAFAINGATPFLAGGPGAGSGNGFDNFLKSTMNATAGAAGGCQYLALPLYSGPVSIAHQISGAVSGNVPTLVDISGQVGGAIIAGDGCPGSMTPMSNTLNALDRFTWNFPRGPVVATMSPAINTSWFFGATAQQGP